MAHLRDVNIQSNPDVFRENIRRIGRILGYEISKTLEYVQGEVQTPLAMHQQPRLKSEVVVITILRAGLPLHDGILSAMPWAENGFISAYRKHREDGSFDIEVGYVACPDLKDKVVILNDPMLATGSSFINAIKALESYGQPKAIHLAAVIASSFGIDSLLKATDPDIKLWVAAIDPELNDRKYIVPGLGDAGDLAFGQKVQS